MRHDTGSIHTFWIVGAYASSPRRCQMQPFSLFALIFAYALSFLAGKGFETFASIYKLPRIPLQVGNLFHKSRPPAKPVL